MKINPEYRKIIVDEFLYTAKMMREISSLEQKNFYFSSTYGVLSRIFNLDYDPHLVFLHFILNNAYGNINARLQAMKAGDEVISIEKDYFEVLSQYVETLANQIAKDEETYKTLEKIGELVFMTTGNGFYLAQKGKIKLGG